MKKILLLLVMAIVVAMQGRALTYEEAFNSIKELPDMEGVKGTEVSEHNDFEAIGITDGELMVWHGERGSQTGVYGNVLYKLIGEMPVSEMVQCHMSGSSLFAIFAKPVSEHSNRIIIFSDSAYAGFTGAILGYISDEALSLLKSAILISRSEGGTALYINAMNF